MAHILIWFNNHFDASTLRNVYDPTDVDSILKINGIENIDNIDYINIIDIDDNNNKFNLVGTKVDWHSWMQCHVINAME